MMLSALRLRKSQFFRLAIDEMFCKFISGDKPDTEVAIRDLRAPMDRGAKWANQVTTSLGNTEWAALEYLEHELRANRAETVRVALRYTAYAMGGLDVSIAHLASMIVAEGGRFPPLLPENGGPRSDV